MWPSDKNVWRPLLCSKQLQNFSETHDRKIEINQRTFYLRLSHVDEQKKEKATQRQPFFYLKVFKRTQLAKGNVETNSGETPYRDSLQTYN